MEEIIKYIEYYLLKNTPIPFTQANVALTYMKEITKLARILLVEKHHNDFLTIFQFFCVHELCVSMLYDNG